MAKFNIRSTRLPETPGVYFMKNSGGEIIYIGKAGNLKRRVSSYFMRPQDYRIGKMVSQIHSVAYQKTDTVIEALILEADLIKKYQPVFNVREKDDKSFICVEVTKEKFPRVLLVRSQTRLGGRRFGPFTSASSIREALKILRRIFPYSAHRTDAESLKKMKPCFDFQIGLCPGTCVGGITEKEYRKNIKNLELFFRGKKTLIIKRLNKEMRAASIKMEFEKAAKLKRQIFALRHIQDIALITDSEARDSSFTFHDLFRIEGYDVSNISGTSAVGSMAVFENNRPRKSEYRLFRIRTIRQANDVGMLKEVLTRRLSHREWPLPDLIMVDGGIGQVNGAKRVLAANGMRMPIVGIAKGPMRKKNEIIGKLPEGVSQDMLIKLRDEAHQFALGYHKKLRNRSLLTDY